MTGTVIQIVIDSIPATPPQVLASPAHAIVLGLLIVVLVARLLIRVREIADAATITRTLDVALVPLFGGFVLILYIRLLEIVPLG
jgi:hypothetical protein